MPTAKDYISVTIRIKHAQLTRLETLRKALEEKYGKEMTKSELIEKILDDFFEK